MEYSGSPPHSLEVPISPYPNSDQYSQCPYPTWRSTLILSSHLRLSLLSGLLPSDFPTKTLFVPLLPHTPYMPNPSNSSWFRNPSNTVYWFKTNFFCFLYNVCRNIFLSDKHVVIYAEYLLRNERYFSPIPVAKRSKPWVCSCSPAGIAGSNPAGDMGVCLLCYVFVR